MPANKADSSLCGEFRVQFHVFLLTHTYVYYIRPSCCRRFSWFRRKRKATVDPPSFGTSKYSWRYARCTVACIYMCRCRSVTTSRLSKGGKLKVKVRKPSSWPIHRKPYGCKLCVPIHFSENEEKVRLFVIVLVLKTVSADLFRKRKARYNYSERSVFFYTLVLM